MGLGAEVVGDLVGAPEQHRTGHRGDQQGDEDAPV